MAKDVGIKLTGDAAGAVRACDDTVRAMSGISRIAKTLTNENVDLAATYKLLGERGGAGIQGIIDAGQAANKSAKEIKAEVLAYTAEQTKAAKEHKAGLIEQAQNAANVSVTIASALGPINDMVSGLKSFTAESKRSAGEIAGVRRELGTLVKDSKQLDEMVGGIRELSLNTRVEVSELGAAAKAMAVQKVYSQDLLKASLDLSAATGMGARDSAQLFAVIARGGDPATRAMKQLSREAGISMQDLVAAGAEVRDGKLFSGTPEAAEKLQKALIGASETKFPDAAKAAMSASDRLRKEWEQLQVETGKAAAKIDGFTKGVMADFVHALNKLPDSVKGAAGQLVDFSGKAAGAGASTVQFLTNLSLMAAAASAVKDRLVSMGTAINDWSGEGGLLTKMGTRIGAVGASFAGFAAVGAAVAIPFLLAARASTAALNEELAANQQHAAEVASRAQTLQQARIDGWAGKSAESLASMGVSGKALSQAIVGVNDRLKDAHNSNQQTFVSYEMVNGKVQQVTRTKAEHIAALERERAQLQSTKNEMGAYERVMGKVIETSEDAQQAVDRATAAYARQAGTRQHLVDALSKQVQQAQEDVNTAQDDKAKEDATKRLEAAQKALFDLQNSARQKATSDAQAAANSEAQLGQMQIQNLQAIAKEKEMAGSKTIADQEAVTQAEIDNAALVRDNAMKAAADKYQAEVEAGTDSVEAGRRFELEKEVIEETYQSKVRSLVDGQVEYEKRAREEMLGFQRQRIQEELSYIDDEMRVLEVRRKFGVDTTRQEMALNAQKYDAMVRDENKVHALNLSKAKGPDEQRNEDARHRAALAHLENQYQMSALELQQRQQEEVRKTLDLERQHVAALQAGVDTEIALLENKRSHGLNVENEMADAIKRRTKLAIEGINKERDAQMSTENDPRKRAAIEEKAAADIKRARVEGDLSLERNHEAEISRQAQLKQAHEQTVQAAVSAKDREIAALEEKTNRSIGDEEKIKRAIEERRELAVKAAEAARDAALMEAEKIQDTQLRAEKVAQANARYNADRNSAEDSYIGQLEKQLKKLEEIEGKKKGPAMSVEEAFAGPQLGLSSFSLSTGADEIKRKIREARDKQARNTEQTADAASSDANATVDTSGGQHAAGTNSVATTGATSAGTSTGAPPSTRTGYASERAQKEASTIGPSGAGELLGLARKGVEYLAQIAEQKSPAKATGSTTADAATSLGMALGRDAFFSKGK